MYSSEKTEKWFNDYVDSFRIEGELARMQELKRRHSFRVQRLASAISREWREENAPGLPTPWGCCTTRRGQYVIINLSGQREFRPRRSRAGYWPDSLWASIGAIKRKCWRRCLPAKDRYRPTCRSRSTAGALIRDADKKTSSAWCRAALTRHRI
ncbi:MAG: hypothetical protein ACLUEQ_04875 [Cloacibacillus evryensis]